MPPDVYQGQPLDKKGLSNVLSVVAKQYPEKYRDISFRLNQLGRDVAYTTGGNSFGLKHLRKAVAARKNREKLQLQLQQVLDRDDIDDNRRNEEIVKLVGNIVNDTERDEVFDESDKEGNPLAQQLKGAGRGNRVNLGALRASDGLYNDHRGRVIPVPVLKSYSEGLTPLEYWASTYGARHGLIHTKFSVSDTGFFGKQLAQVAHRLMVTDLDRDGEPDTLQGLPVDTDDADNEGAMLAYGVGGYPRNTILTPKILRALKAAGHNRILVRSPVVSGSPDGGVYARDVGVREFGRLPGVGDRVGITAAQAIGEPLSQAMLGSKHAGGVAGSGKTQSAFDTLNQFLQVPKTIKGGAAHAHVDGIVRSVEEAPAGGFYVTIGQDRHYVARDFPVLVKPGDQVEAGDVISEGLPNPAEVVRYKGVGEGRRYFTKSFLQALRNSGVNAHRRNVELISRGLINHVVLNKEMGDYVQDDIVPYSVLEHAYKPREGFKTIAPRQAVGRYLERPYLHYSIGTKVRPSMLKDFDEFGVKTVDVHDEEPPFEPEMVRGMSSLQHDPDWMTRMFGSYLKTGFTEAVQRGSTSTQAGTSFVPSLAKGTEFGKQRRTGSVLK